MNGLQYVLDLMDRTFSNGISRAKSETRGLDNAVNNTNRNIGKLKATGQTTFSSIAQYAKTAGLAIIAALSIGAVINFGKEITTLSAKFEGMENAIVFASGQEGGKNIEFLNGTIKRLNLNMESSYKGFQTLTGSLKGTALEGLATRDIFEGVGIAASVMNLTAEQSEGAFLALSQMASKGVVSAEELRGQLGERLPGAMGIAAKAMGVTQSKLGDMLQKGEIIATDFLPKFAKELKNTFEGGLPAAMNSMQSSINRQENALTQFKLKTAETFRPLIIGVLEAGNKLFSFLSDLQNYTEPVKNAIKGIAVAFQPLVNAIMNNPFMKLSTDGNIAKNVMDGIGAVITFITPLFDLVAKILVGVEQAINFVRIALVDNIKSMHESGNVAQFLSNVMGVLTWVWELIAPAINYVGEILGVVINVVFQAIDAILGVVNAIFEWGKKTEWVQRVLNSLVGVVQSVFKSIRDIAVNVLGSVGDLMVGIFTLDINKIKSSLAKGFTAVKETGLLIPKALESGYKGWNKELEKPISKDIKVITKNKDDKAIPPTALAPNSAPISLSATEDKNKKDKKSKSLAGSGSATNDGKHNTFNIQSFVKDLHIHVTNMKENSQEIKSMVRQIFEEAIADIEIRANA